MDGIIKFFPPIHKEGFPFIIIAVIATLFFMLFSSVLGMIGITLTIYCIYFFRDPYRIVPEGDQWLVSPADGIVTAIEEKNAPEELGLGGIPMVRVSIFLSIFNVHVNRLPVTGTIRSLMYRAGKFLSVTLDKASEVNERQIIIMESKKGKRPIAVVQIAGLIARRIVCNLEENTQVQGGNRFGIIRFGSRVDVYFPTDSAPQVLVGQTMIGGETIIAELGNATATPTGRVE